MNFPMSSILRRRVPRILCSSDNHKRHPPTGTADLLTGREENVRRGVIMSDARGRDFVLMAGFGSAGRRHFRNLRSLGCRDFIFLRSGLGTLDDSEISEFTSTNVSDEALGYRPKAAVIATPTAMHLGDRRYRQRRRAATSISRSRSDTN